MTSTPTSRTAVATSSPTHATPSTISSTVTTQAARQAKPSPREIASTASSTNTLGYLDLAGSDSRPMRLDFARSPSGAPSQGPGVRSQEARKISIICALYKPSQILKALHSQFGDDMPIMEKMLQILGDNWTESARNKDTNQVVTPEQHTQLAELAVRAQCELASGYLRGRRGPLRKR